MSDLGKNEEIAALPFEDALRELEQIVTKLETGKVSLEESITIYARGAQLKKHCDDKLKEANARIEKIVVASDGTISAAPFQ